MASASDHGLWQREQEFLKEEQRRSPELFVVEKRPAHELMERIGILGVPENLPYGYIRFSPLDFIVEEHLKEGVVTVDEQKILPIPEGQGSVYADLIKMGLSTLDATQRMADALGVDVKTIGHAGIKDAVALTAQRISVRGGDPARIASLSIPNLSLHHIREGKGAVQVGELVGNRFTLTIRTEQSFDSSLCETRLNRMIKEGVPNFFGPQRFGSPRYLAHVLGLHLFRGDYQKLVETYLLDLCPLERPYLQRIRQEMKRRYGDWKAMRILTDQLPYSFRHERVMLEVLESHKEANKFIRAIAAVPRQASMWAQSYASYLMNFLLSEAEKNNRSIPETLPLLLTQNPVDLLPYRAFLQKHGTEKFPEHLRPFRAFINLGRTTNRSTRLSPRLHHFKITNVGVVLSFDLPKGAYATTILMFLFDTITGQPTPSWINQTEIDAKKILGIGSLEDVRHSFASVLTAMQESKREEESTE